MKTKPVFLIFLTFVFLFLLAIPVQAESNSFSADDAPMAQPTHKPTKTKKPKKSPTQTRVSPPTSTNVAATVTPSPTHTSDPAFSPTPSITASAMGGTTSTATQTADPAFSPTPTFAVSATVAATNVATQTATSRPGQPARPSPTATSVSLVSSPSSTPVSLATATASSVSQAITLEPGLPPVVAGGLKINLPTATPATPWLETVIAAVSQTSAAEYKSPTLTATYTSTTTAVATTTGTVSVIPVNGDAPLNANPAAAVSSTQDTTGFWMLVYFLASVVFVTILFVGYLRLVVFKASPS